MGADANVHVEERREHWGAVVGVAIGLALIALLVTWIVLQKAHARDGTVLLEAWFPGRLAAGELPFDLRVDNAAMLGEGEEAVQLAPIDLPPETPKPVVPKPPELKKGEKPPEQPRVDWSKLPPGLAGQPPRSVLIVRYPKERAKAELETLFGTPMMGTSIGDVGPSGGRVRVEQGSLPWGSFNANWVYYRQFEQGGTFKDSVAVNLARTDVPLVMFATWSRGEPFSKERLGELLTALAP